jgi:hypothetical protein
LLFAWKAAVEAALDALMAIRPDMSVLWTVGWTFDEEPEQPTADTLAAHVSAGDGHVLALNPVTADGTMRYQVSKRESRQALLAAALHEVAHVEIDGHGQRLRRPADRAVRGGERGRGRPGGGRSSPHRLVRQARLDSVGPGR